ncbi:MULTISPECIES: DUF2513 domain-containing protein [Aeromonas]|uniref:DUF2513 domain-containing protein n=1 Tax=Aeromonas TaxID=642 RepID=UPI00226D26E0|nr:MULTISPECIES: DUF2513 domain-containing protein [Aeromonas]MCX9103452.1 DUF2513 domain-containing protein [Aeromonas veronii]MCX9119103.1 DUF2513 domain-containing protein [Aeromonas veronii]MDM5069903.1 DUF2513 domain-containing protein [Aeromonas salmonicida]
MKRDWETVREMLTKIEAMDSSTGYLSLRDFGADTLEEKYRISGHMKLMMDKGLVEGTINSRLGVQANDFSARALTWEGHEFLDAIRSDTVWNRTKETFADKGLDMTFETIKAVAAAAMTSMLGLSV